MKFIFYIDESGNTGDISFQEKGKGIEDQPFFALAGIGFPENNHLDLLLKELKAKYKVQARELKATNIFQKPDFVEELFENIIKEDYPVFIELMDKRFFMAANIVSYYMFFGLLRTIDQRDRPFAKSLASIFAENFSCNTFAQYSQMCYEPSRENLAEFIQNIKHECDSLIEKKAVKKEIIHYILDRVNSDKDILNGDLEEDFINHFIPLPDLGKQEKKVPMLPHVNAFANLVSRINRFVNSFEDNIEVAILHDQQPQFDEILESYFRKFIINEFSYLTHNYNPTVDYNFSQKYSFNFVDSKEFFGIQIADIIAGCCTKYFNILATNKRSLYDKKLMRTYDVIFGYLTQELFRKTGRGLNIVMSNKMQDELDLIHLNLFHSI